MRKNTGAIKFFF